MRSTSLAALVSALIASLAIAACGGGDKSTPAVVGKRLDVAESAVKDAGLDYQEIGGGAFGIIIKSNWIVCEQEPQAGTKNPSKVKLIVDRTCPDTTTNATSTAGASDADSIELVRGRLEGAGFTVSDEDSTGDPPAQAALQVSMSKGDTTIYRYATESDAKAAAKQYAPLQKSNPDQIRVEVAGTDVYVATVEEPAKVPVSEFAKIMRAAQGEH